MKLHLPHRHGPILDEYEKHGINTDINDRWEKGIDHHPDSEKLLKHLMAIDFELCDDYFCWKKGGDGDNGETLMYQLDMYFELQDKEGSA